MWESESDAGERGLVPVLGVGGSEWHDGLKTDGFVRRDHSWYVNSDIPSDLLVKVGDVSFHLHKYPMISRSGKMGRVIYESATSAASASAAALDPDTAVAELDDLPGGADSFELAARFCYGMAVDLTASNISGLRCAAEYLEMTEDLEEGNLIFKTEAFLSYVVLSSWRDSIVVLKSCEGLSPWAENLQIVRRCSESIAWKACANPRGVRWAYTGAGSGRPPRSGAASPRWNNAGGGGGGSKESSPGRQPVPPSDWWFEDVSVLRIDHFVRVVTAIKVKGMRFDLIGAAITHYASKWLPGLTKDVPHAVSGVDEQWAQVSAAGGLHMIIAGPGGKDDVATSAPAREQRMVVESLISIIPPQRDSVSCGFLLRLLRLAIMLKAAPALVTELEKRVGMQLEQAALPDLLIPSVGRADTAYDVDLVQRLVEHFLVQEQTEQVSYSPGRGEAHAQPEREYYGSAAGARMPPANAAAAAAASSSSGLGLNAKARVARLLDSYLSEVSRDRNLSLTKFQVLAESLPESARTCDDGLYRAVDSYLKAHPALTEHERKRLCRVMDCQKLSFDACMHAAQNERLPLRVVVQVLFSEQVKISNALAGSSALKAAPDGGTTSAPTRRQLLDATPQSFQEGWAAAKKDINTLKFELESMKAKYLELQHDMDALQKQVTQSPAGEHGGKVGGGGGKAQQQQGPSAWSNGWKKLGRLAKMTGAEAAGAGGHGHAAAQGEAARKAQRRWRNSIS
ncbi:coleoptile phototropism protein 1-like [Triticum dicoccoides]|uniref:coleoptile phototropism protein 1-like n=1 Tax=Triticum dicoccoides TaxID=85692 RepID=UPI000E7BA4F7|nr:coleoptile phototropism protein 1-like [Triticum dicoccoides]XP_037455604.1 coleoptile phototropism protein 1-like [Triticum dicoccoides]